MERGRRGKEKKAGIFISSFVFKTLFVVGHRLGPLKYRRERLVSLVKGRLREENSGVRNRQIKGERRSHPTFTTCWEAGSFAEK